MTILTVIGARPQFIKASAVSRAIERHNSEHPHNKITEILLHTGQHYDYNMSQIFFDELKIPAPRYHLDIRSGHHGEMTGLMLSHIEPILIEEKPDIIMVYGDTNSTLAGALAAAKLHIPVVHVEAGLRSFNREMPEEINRVLTDHISSFLFCPTDTSVENLRREGISEGVFKVGDVMFDSFLFCKDLAFHRSHVLSELGLHPNEYFLATIHRQGNSDSITNLTSLLDALEHLARTNHPVIFPVHPRTARNIMNGPAKARLASDLRLIPPVSYLDMIVLETQARLILTDSGGVQKEAYFAGIPCITLRNETEWTETVESGWNHLAGIEYGKIVDTCKKTLCSPPSARPAFYGNGDAAVRITEQLRSLS